MSKVRGVVVVACLGLAWGLSAGAARADAKAVSPDGKLEAVGGDGEVKLIDVGTQKVLVRMAGHTGKVTAVAFSPDGKRLASGGADKTVRVWDLATGKLLFKFVGHAGAIKSVAYSKDGKTLITRGAKATREWDAATGKLIRKTDN